MDDDSPRPRGDAASRLATEDLSPYSRHELLARLALLDAEGERVRRQLEQAHSTRAAADALFGRKG